MHYLKKTPIYDYQEVHWVENYVFNAQNRINWIFTSAFLFTFVVGKNILVI